MLTSPYSTQCTEFAVPAACGGGIATRGHDICEISIAGIGFLIKNIYFGLPLTYAYATLRQRVARNLHFGVIIKKFLHRDINLDRMVCMYCRNPYFPRGDKIYISVLTEFV
jgi:hypothetical protein